MYQKLNIPTLGVVENMSYYACPNCHHEADIFGHGGGEGLATDMGVPFLGRLPIYQPIREGSDTGVPLVDQRAGVGGGASVPDRGGANGGAGVDRGAQGGRGEQGQDSAHPGAMSADTDLDHDALAIDLPFTKRTLANGLDVIVHEDHHVPIVAVNVWYHVGSKNERPGRTGFAHLFEHLMFEGSEHHDAGYFPPLQQAGALLNGSTNADRTNYWEVVPTSAVDLALWMESDRMGYLLPALTRERFETQRDVVLNERRQNYENRPYGLAMMALVGGAVPAGSSVQLDDDRRRPRTSARCSSRTCRSSSAPTTTRRTRRSCWPATSIPSGPSIWPSAYFGEIPAGRPPAAGRAPAPRSLAEQRLVLEDRVELPRIYMAWHSPAMFAADDAETGSGRRPAGQRQDVAPVPDAGLRAAHRARRVGVPELARDRQLLPARGDRGAGRSR